MRKIALFFLIGFIYLVFPRTSFAALIFEDNFDQYSNGSFPSKWSVYNSTCNPIWKVETGILKIKNAPGCVTHLIPNTSNWQTPLDDYVAEFDVRFISGIDRHVSYRINPNIPFIRVLHFIIPSGFALDTDNQNYLTNIVKGYQNNVTYHFKVIVTSERITIYESNGNTADLVLTRDIFFTNPLPPGMIGLGSSPGGGSGMTETWFDNVKVTTIDNSLDVPLLKQTDPLWADDIYDSAGLWTTESPTIGRWGCAITSAAMVLNYHKINKLPDGTLLNPGTLNSYLKSTPDGYVRNGLTNWQAITVMATNAKPQNPYFNFNSLEFAWGNDNLSDLQGDIDNNIPNILEVDMPNGGSHFVVARGVDDEEVIINDPAFDRTDLAEYSNSYKSTRRFVPSNSDLSYMMFVVDPQVDISLKDGLGNTIGNVAMESPIEDPLGLLNNSSGPLKVVHFSKPETDNFVVEISSTSTNVYQLDGYVYDENGEVKLFSNKGFVNSGNSDMFGIDFDKSNINNISINNPQNTLQSLISDLDILMQLGHFTNNGSYISIRNILNNSQRMLLENPNVSKRLLVNLKKILMDGEKDGIDEFASQYLVEQITLLLSAL
ncbi:MAG: C39 family peptidase [Candidatus Levybacteria bacterium]|nr:C39 family peptidase [Candidatus Levybacteria bacterium]